MKRTVKNLVKALLTLLLLFLVYRKVDGAQFLEVLKGVRFEILPIFFAVAFANMWLSSCRWNCLLRADGFSVPTRLLFISHWIASFFNFFLPSNIGGDVYRIADIGKRSGRAAGSVASVFVERLCGFMAMSFLGFTFPLLGLSMIPPEQRVYLWVPMALFLGFLCLGLLLLQPRPVRWVLRRFLPRPAGKMVEAFLEPFFASVSSYLKRPRVLLQVVGISLVFQFLVIVAVYIVGRAIGLEIAFSRYCVYVPFVCLLESLPITMNGMGLRDAGYTLFLTAVGVAEAATLAGTLSLCYVALTFLYALGGGIVFLFRLFEKKTNACEKKG